MPILRRDNELTSNLQILAIAFNIGFELPTFS